MNMKYCSSALGLPRAGNMRMTVSICGHM